MPDPIPLLAHGDVDHGCSAAGLFLIQKLQLKIVIKDIYHVGGDSADRSLFLLHPAQDNVQ